MDQPASSVRFESDQPIAFDPRRVHCPVDLLLTVMAGRWKPSILWCLAQADGPVRFNALRRRLPAVSERVLARQLRDLERHGIVYRQVYAVVPPHVEYGLTPRGESVRPILRAMCDWGKEQGFGRSAPTS
jgi:DNA-binding HxlR family transcriptional regulator